MLSLLADATSTTAAAVGLSLLQYGIAGATFAWVLAIVVRPLITSAIAQQGRAIDVLEKSVTIHAESTAALQQSVRTNTEAVDLFRRYEASNAARQERIMEVQGRTLEVLGSIQEKLAR
jgi:hypothetical protein